jgi:hypothetical protein
MPSLSPASAEAPDTTFAALQAAIARIERGGSAAVRRDAVPLGLPAIDAVLPGGGLAAGVVHEVTGSAAGGFVAMAAGRFAGPVRWCVMASSRTELYGPGLAAVGLDTRTRSSRAAPAGRTCCGRWKKACATPPGRRSASRTARSLTASRRLQLAADIGRRHRAGAAARTEEGALAPSAVFSAGGPIRRRHWACRRRSSGRLRKTGADYTRSRFPSAGGSTCRAAAAASTKYMGYAKNGPKPDRGLVRCDVIFWFPLAIDRLGGARRIAGG